MGLPLPLGQLFARAPQNPHPDRNNQARVFSQRNEIDRAYKAALRMLPTNQRFKTRKLAIFQRNDRLVMNAKLLALEGAAQVCFHLQQVNRARVHAFVEHFVASFALRFSAIHRGVGVAQHVFRMIVAG